MSTHNICFRREISKTGSDTFQLKKKSLIWNYVTYPRMLEGIFSRDPDHFSIPAGILVMDMSRFNASEKLNQV